MCVVHKPLHFLSNVQALVRKTELCYSKESKATTVSRAAEAAAQTPRREGSGGSDKCFCFTSLLSLPSSAFSKALQSGLDALSPDILARLGQTFPAPRRDARTLPTGTAGPSPPRGAAASPSPRPATHCSAPAAQLHRRQGKENQQKLVVPPGCASTAAPGLLPSPSWAGRSRSWPGRRAGSRAGDGACLAVPAQVPAPTQCHQAGAG